MRENLRRHVFVRVWLMAAACLLMTAAMQAQTGDTAAPATTTAAPAKKQLPADERAWKKARATMDPAKRLEAMRAFVHDYPKSKSYIGRAQNQILSILLNDFPDRAAEIDAQAKLIVKMGGKGLDGATTKTYTAFALAEAGTAGVDLAYAEKLAADALKLLKEPAYNENTLKMYARFKVPVPKPAELHRSFASARAEALAVLADVYLREGKTDKAAPLITEAYGLDPLVDDVNSQRGRLALLRHDDALALESFERAQLVGAVSKEDRKTMLDLYRKAHGGSDAGFAEELDARYEKLYPESFTPASVTPASTGRTVLVELFTGSACGPCVGGDMAVEAVLHAYPRSELVALAFDQHIPEPDPLTNPDSLARAEVYDVNSTPSYVVDGRKQEGLYGGDRESSRDLYEKLARVVDGEASLANDINLKLSVTEAGGGLVQAHAVVRLPAEAEVEKAIAAKPIPKPDPNAAPKTETAATPAAKTDKAKAKKQKTAPPAAPAASKPTEAAKAPEPVKPHLVVNFALVEDDVRYSGENGVRFHRMVVRALAKPAAEGFDARPDGTATLDASFDPAAISRTLTSYLDGFEADNPRFGKVTFLTKDTTMLPAHLAVAAWVQDTVSHRVLQSALATLAPAPSAKGAE